MMSHDPNIVAYPKYEYVKYTDAEKSRNTDDSVVQVWNIYSLLDF